MATGGGAGAFLFTELGRVGATDGFCTTPGRPGTALGCAGGRGRGFDDVSVGLRRPEMWGVLAFWSTARTKIHNKFRHCAGVLHW